MKLIDRMQKVRVQHEKLLKSRLEQFKALRSASEDSIFIELCFCLLTANFNAERAIGIQEQINNGFSSLSQEELASRLKELGYRFPNRRAEFIVEARQHKPQLKKLVNSIPELELRNWLAKNIKGLGMKEASHFLRNIGFTNVAIIDFHIIDLLEREGIIKRPKSLTKNEYLRIEDELRQFGTNLAELDLVLWYLETGKILK